MPVPEYLKPHLRKIIFVFYPKKHRLFFDMHKFSPNNARRLLSALFSHDTIVKNFGHVDVEVETSKEAIEKILEIPSKTKLEIKISLPNPDDISEEEQRVIDRLKNQNARTVKETYTSTKEEGLKPDHETITLMRVVKSNGYVHVTGYEGEKKIEKSTLDHPLFEQEYYNPDTTTTKDALLGLSGRLMASIAKS